MKIKFDLVEEVVIQYELSYDDSIEDIELYIQENYNGNPWHAMSGDPLIHDIAHDVIIEYIDNDLTTLDYS